MSATVVIGWSPDRYGTAAVRHGIAEAELRDATLVVVNATRGDAYVDEAYARSEEVTALQEELASSGVGYEIHQRLGEDIGDVVLTVAGEVSATLIVVGVRRRTPVGKLLMGSVAQRVILGAECPVLAVKA